MPSLHLFRRKTVIAGDDLQPAALITIVVRMIQIFAFILSISIHVSREYHRFLALTKSTLNINQNDKRYEYFFGGNDLYPENSICNAAHFFPLLLVIYLSLSTIQATTSIFIERRVFALSSVGTPIESYKRNPSLSKVLQRHYIWGHIVGNSIILTFGLICCFGYAKIYYNCRDSIQRQQLIRTQQQLSFHVEPNESLTSFSLDAPGFIADRSIYNRKNLSYTSPWWPSAWWVPLILLLLSQGAELLLTSLRIMGLLLKEKAQPFISNTIDVESSSEIQSIHHSNHAIVEAMWDQRIRACFQCAARSTCFLFGGKDLVRNMAGDYGDIARTLADFFEYGEVLDLTPTDLAVSFMMLQRVQRQRVLEARKEVVDSSRMIHNARADWSIRTNAGSFIDDATRLSMSSDAQSSSTSLSKLGDISETLSVTKDNESSSSILNSPVCRTDLHDRKSSLAPLTMASLKMLSDDKRDSRHWYETEQRRVLSRNDERDRYAIAEGARFSRFALGIYTWVLYVYVKPVTGSVDLYFRGCRDACCNKRSVQTHSRYGKENRDEREEASASDSLRGDSTLIEGENCCHMHTNALLRHIGLERCDLVYANFKNKYNQMPYCVVLDHCWQR